MSLLLLLTCYNSITYCIMGADKLFAKLNMRRISEKTLIISALLFGGVGAYAGSLFFIIKQENHYLKQHFLLLAP